MCDNDNNNDYIEELTEEDEEYYFSEASITNKEALLSELKYRKRELENQSKSDTKHSSAYYHILLTLLDHFTEVVKKTVFFEKLEPFWSYSYEISSDGIVLSLSHFYGVDFDNDHNITGSYCNQDFELIRTPCKMLTIDEYSKLYGIEKVTVRQWIRRGKIRTAKKYGKEWRIPELTDFPSRGYRFGQYEIKKEAVFPDEYAFISEYSIVSFRQDDNDKTKYHIYFDAGKKNKSIICDARERERIELMLIENPFVKFISDSFGIFA